VKILKDPQSGRLEAPHGVTTAFTSDVCAAPVLFVTSAFTVNADVLEHFVPGFRRGDFVDVILDSAWPE